MNRRLFLSLCTALIALAGSPARAETLNVSDAWVRQGPPTAQVLAAYMTLENPGTQEIAIIGAGSPQFETVEIHRTEIVDGMARMIPQERLAIPAGGNVALEPNGLHLMLINAKQPLAAGAVVRIELRLEGGGSVTVDAPVRADAGMPEGMDHSQHQHHH